MNSNIWLFCIAEFIGTALLVILGNGSVANVELKGTKGYKSGWLTIAIGYGCGVMIPAMMFGNISGNNINPAFTIGLLFSGHFEAGALVAVYYIIAQFLGAIIGQLIVVATHKPYYDKTESEEAILATFSTSNAAGSKLNGFANEFFGSFILFFGALAMINNTFNGVADKELAHFALGFLVMTLVASLGGPTGPGLNPARDLGPRIVHALLPLKNKGKSDWSYAWVPVLAPIIASIAACFLYFFLFPGK